MGGPSVTLLLVRHGESAGNARRLIQGWHEFPLTERGHRQADAVSRQLAGAGAVALYASPILRAWQTAAPIAAATGLTPVRTDGLREYGFGEAEGLHWQEAATRWGLSEDDWGVGRVPGEEGFEAFRDRVAQTVETLAARHTGEVAICVLHAGTVGTLVGYICGMGPHEHATLFTGNCGIATVHRDRGRLEIVALNDQSHLALDER